MDFWSCNTWNVIIIVNLHMDFFVCGYCFKNFTENSISFFKNHEEFINEFLLEKYFVKL